MSVVLLSLGSAFAYGLGDFLGGLLSRRIQVWTVAVVAQTASALGAGAAVLLFPGDPTTPDWGWGALAGIGSGIGTVALYRGLGGGRMSVVAPLSGVTAALLPVLVGVLAGERPSPVTWIGVACALPAIWLVSRSTGAEISDRRSRRAGVTDGLLAGAGFGALFGGLGLVSNGAGAGPLALAQLTSVASIVGMALGLRRKWLPKDGSAARAALPGLLGALATVLFLRATQTGLLTVAAVLSSLYPAATVVLAAVVLKEHIRVQQGAGLVLAGAAVALVAAG
jgi:drug/metabolite transporter (DMT)-like permease